MDDIEKLWKDMNIEYYDMYSRLSYISSKGPKILEKIPIKDKLNLLRSDFKEVLNSIEKVSSSIDEIYADSGVIDTKIHKDVNIHVKRINTDGKFIKTIDS